MKNKTLFQDKVTKLELELNTISRMVSLNDRQEAFRHITVAKSLLEDMQTMLNREQEYFR